MNVQSHIYIARPQMMMREFSSHVQKSIYMRIHNKEWEQVLELENLVLMHPCLPLVTVKPVNSNNSSVILVLRCKVVEILSLIR
jgi:hypothetical protein